jgi:hypothetical protein
VRTAGRWLVLGWLLAALVVLGMDGRLPAFLGWATLGSLLVLARRRAGPPAARTVPLLPATAAGALPGRRRPGRAAGRSGGRGRTGRLDAQVVTVPFGSTRLARQNRAS